MTCSPARSSRATKGVVFQMSTTQTDASAVLGSAIHATPLSMTWIRIRKSLKTPKMSLYIQRHIWAATTVGIAQGTSITARMTPRPLKPEFTTRAMIIPSTSSKDTVIAVNFRVSQTESHQNGSSIRLR
jgi:hypothetical protein